MTITRRTTIPLLFITSGLWGQPDRSDQELALFIKWMKALPPGSVGTLRELYVAYEKKVIADGISPVEAKALIGRLQKRAVESPEWLRARFNQIYSQRNTDLNPAPNPFLVETVLALRPGKALDLGMGNGRNAIFLAQQGWEVTGLYLSDVGVAQAQERARKLGVRIDARVQDVDAFDFGAGQWDLICLLFFLIQDRQQGLYQRMATGLRPGGLVIVEGLGLPVLETLLQAWPKWEPTKLRPIRLEYREGVTENLDKTWGGSGNSYGRLLLQKPT